jgi:hypothetical protein
MGQRTLPGDERVSQEVATRSRLPRIAPPSITAVVFVLIATLVPILLQKAVLNSDGDLARHLRHGRYMLEHGSLIRFDPFSFTRPGAPFVGFEYGSQIMYALAERAGGLPAVAVLAGLLIGLTYALLTRFLLQRGVDPLLAFLTVALAAALGAGHWSARPHLFSFVAVVILLAMMEGRPRKPVLACAALFVCWANLHGGFVYGWILIGLYLVGSLGELVVGHDRAAWRGRVRYYLTMLATATTVTLLNPHGLELHRHLMGFFDKPFLLDNTVEFVSPDFHESSGKVFLAILLLTLGSLSLHSRRPTLPRFLVMGAGAAFALISVRNIPLFGLTALPVLALHVDEIWRRLPDPGGVRGRFDVTASRTTTLPWALPVILLLCGLALARGRLGSLRLIRDQFDGTVFPVAAVAKARNEHLEGRLFSDFAWGGYVVYAWPEQKIFIDGGTDFFGEDIFGEYRKIKTLVPGWRELVKKWDISLMLLRRESALAHELVRDGRWNLWYCDSLTVILRGSPATSARTPDAADSAEHALEACAGGPQVRSATPTRDKPQGSVAWRKIAPSPAKSAARASLISQGVDLVSDRGCCRRYLLASMRCTQITGKSAAFQYESQRSRSPPCSSNLRRVVLL